jgi:hypothetical protein
MWPMEQYLLLFVLFEQVPVDHFATLLHLQHFLAVDSYHDFLNLDYHLYFRLVVAVMPF